MKMNDIKKIGRVLTAIWLVVTCILLISSMTIMVSGILADNRYTAETGMAIGVIGTLSMGIGFLTFVAVGFITSLFPPTASAENPSEESSVQ